MTIVTADSRLTRIGVFYDGNFFAHVSNYYLFNHPRKARISIEGLHEFIRNEVATREGADVRYCHVVDAHYFRGRLSASDAQARDTLFADRVLDEILMREGVITHYLPLTAGGEKGIDVWLALEAFELAVYKRFNVSVLVAGDGDFVPLVRKLNTIGTRVMVLGWDFKYLENGLQRETRTSQALLTEVTYPIMVSDIIDDRVRRNEPLINNMFLAKREQQPRPDLGNHNSTPAVPRRSDPVPVGTRGTGSVESKKPTTAFIRVASTNRRIFFHRSKFRGNFDELREGTNVEFTYEVDEKNRACGVDVSPVIFDDSIPFPEVAG